MLTHTPSSSHPLWSFTLPPCCRRHGLWNPNARRSLALILLTFGVTHRFSAWCHSTHSVRKAARGQTRLGAPAAGRESRPALCRPTVSTQNYEPLLANIIDFYTITIHKAAFSVQFSRISSLVVLLILLKKGTFSIAPHAWS